MQEKNLNNSSLGRLLDKSPSTVKFWREGTWPEMPTLVKIAQVLEVTLEYLLFGEKKEEVRSKSASDTISTDEISKDDLIEFYRWKAEKALKQNQELMASNDQLKNNKVDAFTEQLTTKS